MKTCITSVLLVLSITIHAQITVDDFTTGNFSKKTFHSGESEKFYQSGKNIIGKIRRVHVKVGENPYGHSPQLTSSKDGLMVYSAGYDVNSTLYLAYGYSKDGLQPLNLNLKKYSVLKIEFAAKSAKSGMYVTLFTNSDRGVYSNHVPEREGKMTFTIPLSEIRKIGKKFTLSDIDHIIFQFDSRSKTGCNFAIHKISFE